MLNNKPLNDAIVLLYQFLNTTVIPGKLCKLNDLMLSKKQEDKVLYNVLDQEVRSLQSTRDLLHDWINFYKLVESGNYDSAIISCMSEYGLNFSEVHRGKIV